MSKEPLIENLRSNIQNTYLALKKCNKTIKEDYTKVMEDRYPKRGQRNQVNTIKEQ